MPPTLTVILQLSGMSSAESEWCWKNIVSLSHAICLPLSHAPRIGFLSSCIAVVSHLIRADRALFRQIQLEETYQPPRRQDLKKLRTWHEDGRLGDSFIEGNQEDVWDEEKGIHTEQFVRVAHTGDSISNRLAALLTVAPIHFDRVKRSISSIFTRKKVFSDVEMNTPTTTTTTTPASTANNQPATASSSTANASADPAADSNGEGDDDAEPPDLILSLPRTHYQTIIHSVLTVLSSVLPVIPIVVLYVVHSQPVRVGLVFVFTLILAAVITFGLNMRAERVIAITTAFAAVQVVFITTNGVGIGQGMVAVPVPVPVPGTRG